MKSFAQWRAERIAQLQASAAYEANAPRPLVAPVIKLPPRPPRPPPAAPRRRTTRPPRLFTVSGEVLVSLLDILQSEKGADSRWRAVAAEMVRQELGAQSTSMEET